MSLKFRKFKNMLAHGVFTVGGISVIFIILLLISFLLKEILPLFQSAEVIQQWDVHSQKNSNQVSFAQLSEDGRLSFYFRKDGLLILEITKTGEELKTWQLPAPESEVLFQAKQMSFVAGNILYVYPLEFLRDRETGLETDLALGEESQFELPFSGIDLIAVGEVSKENSSFAVAKGNRVFYRYFEYEEDMFGDEPEIIEDLSKEFILESACKGIEFYLGNKLLIANQNGLVLVYDSSGNLKSNFKNPSEISVMKALFGDRAICIGGKDGSINIWSEAISGNSREFFLIHKLPFLKTAIQGFAFNGRDRNFFAWDKEGTLRLYHSTTEKTRLTLYDVPGQNYTFNTKGNYLLQFGKQFKLLKLRNEHSDVSFKTLFGKVWYEGYPAPAYVWQSTGGSQAFESKVSLVPLILGTLKGAVYAMIFALPLALTGALFMNQFLHPNLHRTIKPIVEVMAGLPSVIIGFLAGLWLAPVLESYLPGVLLACLFVPIVTVFVGLMIEKYVFKPGQETFKYEVFWFIPFIILTVFVCFQVTPLVDMLLFGGDFKQFIFEKLGTPYDQRNALVVGFAMGFAVIPIVFSLTEDAISFVPKEIVAGSLALGLSRWKTATGVVVKSASSGILSAVMVGFGRAIGETMIVLMATGNTPVLSFFPFNGFRTMSANIAVELPEAPVDGSLYRLLFLTAFLLFLFTFVVNTLTDYLRQRWQRSLKG